MTDVQLTPHRPRTSKHVERRRATPADAEVGRRVRTRRLQRHLSQTELADKVGVTFQQVQKYEKGVNRIGAGRLQQIAAVLEVPIAYFFDTEDGIKKGESPMLLLQSRGAVQLVEAYAAIKSQKLRELILGLARECAGLKSRKE